MDRQTNIIGAETDAMMKVWEIHEDLCKEMVPHKISYTDAHGNTKYYTLSHSLALDETLDYEEI
jgi:hypothetical protein